MIHSLMAKVNFKYAAMCLAVCTAVLLAGCASSIPRMEHLPAGDERIVAELRAAIEADEELPVDAIRVESREGVVVLRGFLESSDQIRRALELAGWVDGVVRVVNRLRLLSGGDARRPGIRVASAPERR